mmetsp:Transcript_2641/g.9159  ORF Transcript_2641/g.9159 Transcript_2641/m.9159 type:complete len:332 (-) Transcript_2641:1756-2751(-)
MSLARAIAGSEVASRALAAELTAGAATSIAAGVTIAAHAILRRARGRCFELQGSALSPGEAGSLFHPETRCACVAAVDPSSRTAVTTRVTVAALPVRVNRGSHRLVMLRFANGPRRARPLATPEPRRARDAAGSTWSGATVAALVAFRARAILDGRRRSRLVLLRMAHGPRRTRAVIVHPETTRARLAPVGASARASVTLWATIATAAIERAGWCSGLILLSAADAPCLARTVVHPVPSSTAQAIVSPSGSTPVAARATWRALAIRGGGRGRGLEFIGSARRQRCAGSIGTLGAIHQRKLGRRARACTRDALAVVGREKLGCAIAHALAHA